MKIEVIEIKDNPDGSAQYIFEVDEEAKASIMKAAGMKRWSNKRFQEFVIQALDHRIRLGDSDEL
jgi:hypothetical protein